MPDDDSPASGPTSHSYFSQRLRLHYADWGNDEAPNLLLIHGVHDHCHSWDWVAQRLRDRYHVVAPDLRGHGDSQWALGTSYGYYEYVYDIAQLVRQAELEPVTIVAHSMGGTIAAIYAGVYPEKVERLVLVEGIGVYPDAFEGAPHRRLEFWIESGYELAGRVPRRYAELEDACHRMEETNPHLDADQARHLTIHGSNRNEDGTYSWKFDNYTRARAPYDVRGADLVALFERIDCPVLIVNSKQGYPHRIGHGGTERHFKDVRVAEIDAAGHWTHHDQLDAFFEAADAFLPR